MEFKGTKGKWTLHNRAFACVVSDESSLLVSNCGGRTSNVNADELDIEQLANALLISKAPEMLEMLNDVMRALWMTGSKGDLILAESIEKLIKEATEF